MKVNPVVAGDEEEDVHIDEQVQVQVLSGPSPIHEEAEVKEELPVAEPDVQEGFHIEEEEQVQIHVQRAVQSDAGWSYLESIGHIWSVKPEPDAMQRYLEGSGP